MYICIVHVYLHIKYMYIYMHYIYAYVYINIYIYNIYIYILYMLYIITAWSKKVPCFVFHRKVVFYNFFPYFSGGVDSRPRRFDTNMDPTGHYTMQQGIKIIGAYFTAKSVLLTQRQCRKDFGRNSVPDGRTIQCLVAKFWKNGSVADAHKDQHCSSLGIIPENIQNLQAVRNSEFTCSWKILKTLLQRNIESKCLHNFMRFWDFWEHYLALVDLNWFI